MTSANVIGKSNHDKNEILLVKDIELRGSKLLGNPRKNLLRSRKGMISAGISTRPDRKNMMQMFALNSGMCRDRPKYSIPEICLKLIMNMEYYHYFTNFGAAYKSIRDEKNINSI